MPAKTSGWILALIISASGARASFAQATSASMGGEVVSDFKYMSNNVLLDAEDIATSPLYVGSPDSPLRSSHFYLVLAGQGHCGEVRLLSTRLCVAIYAT